MLRAKLFIRNLITKLYIKYVDSVYIPKGTKLKISTKTKSALLICSRTGRGTSFSFLGHNIFFD